MGERAVGFSFKVAPGVRIRASSRGVRTSIGPRAARLHVGGGRTGVSTGAGPVGFYTSLSGSRRSGGGGALPRNAGTSQRALAQAAKHERAQELREALTDLLNLHRQDFPPVSAPQAPPPPAVNVAAVIAEHEQRALAGIGLLQRTARKHARATAAATAQHHVELLESQRQYSWQQAQQQMDLWWESLRRNEPDVVLGVLGEAFEDNEAPAAAVGLDGSEVALVALVPNIHSIPERKPDLTPAGNLTLKKLTKSERGSYHTITAASHVLLTVRETFAVAPGLSAARLIALQHAGEDAYGRPRVEVLLAARFERHRFEGVQWDRVSAGAIMDAVSTETLLNVRRATNELQPLDLRAEPELAALLAQVEVDGLVARA